MTTDDFDYINDAVERFDRDISPLLCLPPDFEAFDWQDQLVILPGGKTVNISLTIMRDAPIEEIMSLILDGRDNLDDPDQRDFSDNRCYPIADKISDYTLWQSLRKQQGLALWKCPRMEQVLLLAAENEKNQKIVKDRRPNLNR